MQFLSSGYRSQSPLSIIFIGVYHQKNAPNINIQSTITNEYLSNKHPGIEAMFKNDVSVFYFFHLSLPSTEWNIWRLSLPALLLFLPYCKQILFGSVSQNETLTWRSVFEQHCQGCAAGGTLSPHSPAFSLTWAAFGLPVICSALLLWMRFTVLF